MSEITFDRHDELNIEEECRKRGISHRRGGKNGQFHIISPDGRNLYVEHSDQAAFERLLKLCS
jgi:hypothetical protein